jgi:hypothetical protein
MELNNTIEFIQNIYSSYNISHSLVVYNKNEITPSDIEALYSCLIDNDFPIFHLTHIPNVVDLSSYENKYRMFMIDYHNLTDFIINKNNDFSNISVIFCLSSSLLHSTCQLIQDNKVKTLQSMHLFSC